MWLSYIQRQTGEKLRYVAKFWVRKTVYFTLPAWIYTGCFRIDHSALSNQLSTGFEG